MRAYAALLLVWAPGFAQAANVSVAEYRIDSAVADIQWVGKDKKTIYVRSQKNMVYRSADEGRTWGRENRKMETNGDDDKSGILSFHVSPADSSKIFFRGVGNQHWHSTDRGTTYTTLASSITIKEVKLHPTESDWMLASHLTPGCKKAQRDECAMEVYLTQDFGKTWKLLQRYVAQFEWAPAADGILKPGMEKSTIFMVSYAMTSGNQPFGVWSAKAEFARSDDLWKTKYTLLPRGNRFLFLDKFIFVAVVNKHHETQVNLYVSAEGGKVFKKARLPFQLTEHSYTILDTSEGSVFLHVNHGDYNTGYGNIYLSDAEGLRFALSLRNNKRDANGRCDFEKVQGIEGIYITNEQINVDDGDAARNRAHPKLRTKISFDKGGKWQLLKAPLTTNTGKAFTCDPNEDPKCSLHLHGVTDSWGPFYSSKSAIGIIMATGNVGLHLSDKEDEVHTFFSRDAGLTWQMARVGSHIYEYGDHGAIIVIADDRKASTEIYYSWDEALNWNELHFTDKAAEIENIVIEPLATSQVFVMYGTRGEAGVLFHIDFSGLHEPQCKGIEQAGEASSDYELWSPSDGRTDGNKCLLGHQVRYTRRRRAAACFNGEMYERSEFRKTCPCAEEDYECDFGYERSTDAGPCVAVMAISSAPPTECSGTYSVSNGYRLVAGDTCDPTKGIDHLPTVNRCPGLFAGAAGVSSSGWTVLWFLLLLLCVLGFVTMRNKGGVRGGVVDMIHSIPLDPGSILSALAALPGALLSLPSTLRNAYSSYKSNRPAQYGRLPDNADEELDLGEDDELDDEAEELRDDYDDPADSSLGTLPTHATPQKAHTEGSLLGEEFTSPHVKKGD